MKLTIIIPALNEAATIGKVIKNIPKKIRGISKIVVVVVDDGSTDKTGKIAEKKGAVVLRHARNTGLGSAFKTGVDFAIDSGTDVMVNIDADGQFYPQDIPRLVSPIVKGEAECTTASRFIDKKLYPKMHWLKFYGNKAMSLLISFLTGQRFYDVSCGMRAYNRHALLNFNLAGRFTYTQEAILNLAYKGIIIKEVPIKVIGQRQNGESKIASNLWRYAFRTSSIIFRAFRDYKPLYFFGIIQSNYIPWRGYFDFIDDVDLFVFYDDVQYTKKNWRNRNRIKTPNGLLWLSVPVLSNRHTMIDEAKILYDSNWIEKHIKSMVLNYRNSLNLDECIEGYSRILTSKYETLSELNITLCKWIMQLLGIKTKIVNSRDLGISGTKYDRPIKILKHLNANSYLSGAVAKGYIDESAFQQAGIKLEYKSYEYLPYKQLWGNSFEPSVTVLDMLCNSPREKWRLYLKSQITNDKASL